MYDPDLYRISPIPNNISLGTMLNHLLMSTCSNTANLFEVSTMHATSIPFVGGYRHSQCHSEYEMVVYGSPPGRSRAAGPLRPSVYLPSACTQQVLKITYIIHDRSSDTNPACSVERF